MKNLLQYSLYSFMALALCLMLAACTSDSDLGLESGDSGTGGSLARFVVAGNFLYTVDNQHIKTVSVADPANPTLLDVQEIAEGVESIFRLGERLFIGSSTGLFLYTFGADGIPVRQGEFLYSELNFPIQPCDPVVANDSFAYVTLNSTIAVERCNRSTLGQVKVLNIFNVSNIEQPELVAQYDMLNPQGVGLDGDLLFVCQQEFGLEVYDISIPSDPQLLTRMHDINAHDVIPLGGLLLVVGPDNVFQVDYTDLSNIHLLSQIPIEP